MRKNKKINIMAGVFLAAMFGGLALNGSAFADEVYTVEDFGGDEEFFSCVLRAAHLSNVDSISQAQASDITSLGCNNTEGQYAHLATIEGIELLPSLKTVALINLPELESIDLSSNNILTEVTIDGNSKLESVVMGQQPLLPMLYVENNVNLQQIDLSGATRITSLHLNNNKLTSIDLSHNTKLNSLILSNNKLKTINLSANEDLDLVYLYNNDIEFIDLTQISDEVGVLNLDDNVLVRTGFKAIQSKEGGNYYVSTSTSGYMFIPLINMTGLNVSSTIITTEGANYYHDATHCAAGDPFCIIFDADILDYQDYIQLEYVGAESTADETKSGMENTHKNYRLEIALEDYEEEKEEEKEEEEKGPAVPDTGMFSGDNDGLKFTLIGVASAVSIVIAGLVAYGIKRYSGKVKFD